MVQRDAMVDGVIVIPTYNEAENIERHIAAVRAAQPGCDVLILDDNSPDGTGEIVAQLASSDPRVSVWRRPAKRGLGVAYVEGFQRVLEADYGFVVQMDADGSHRPDQIERLIEGLRHADVVIGSRWVRGGSVRNWTLHRALLSRVGNRYIRLMLRLPVNDATAGFRAYSSDALRRLGIDSVDTRGYGFQTEVTRRAIGSGLRVVEVPIDFADRVLGQSKMSADVMAETLLRVTRWGVQDAARAVRARARSLIKKSRR